jgi:ribosome-binding protein aMBF1 (putative translation factor)
MIYAGPVRQGDCDSGQLSVWEGKAKDQSELDSFVQQALNCDGVDEMRKRIRDDSHIDDKPVDEHEKDYRVPKLNSSKDIRELERWTDRDIVFDYASGYPYLKAVELDGWKIEELAAKTGVKRGVVGRIISKEKAKLKKAEQELAKIQRSR